MKKIVRKELLWSSARLVLETGRLAKQATGSVLVSYGNTSVLSCVCVGDEEKKGCGFLPLSVHYQEKFSAYGRIPGGFLKREGRPTEREMLISRLIDRPLRSVINSDFNRDIQIFCTLFSYDGSNLPEIPAIIASSAALLFAGVSFDKLIAACRIGLVEDDLILNPVYDQLESSSIDVILAGDTEHIVMIEGQAKQVQHKYIEEALDFGKSQLKDVLDCLREMEEELSPEKLIFSSVAWEKEINIDQLDKKITNIENKENLEKAFTIADKLERKKSIVNLEKAVYEKILKEFSEKNNEHLIDFIPSLRAYFLIKWKTFLRETVRSFVKKTGLRIGKRKDADVRRVTCEISPLEVPHGSALFTRGDTQVLVTVTLGSTYDKQIVESPNGEFSSSFMLHYNFPPYSVGETTTKIGGPSRRDIGHGALAKKAILPVIPDKDNFPYVVRIISDVLESDGSSSMATICGSSLALMDAGVRLENPVAGIAMGLFLFNSDDFHIISDITGEEDMAGDMDFKIAATKEGVTAIQLDTKTSGLSSEIIKETFKQALKGIAEILETMNKEISAGRSSYKSNVPTILFFYIPKEKIPEVIGPGGKNVKILSLNFNVKIDISEDGGVEVFGLNRDNVKSVKKKIMSSIMTLEVGQVFKGVVSLLREAGAFIQLPVGKNKGWLHVSEVSRNRGESISSILKIGDVLSVKIAQIDPKGRIRLSSLDKGRIKRRKESSSKKNKVVTWCDE